MARRIDRRRARLGRTDDACATCGHEGMELIESSRVMAGAGLKRRLQGRRTRQYLRCPECGARAAAPHPERTASPMATALGWLGVAILALVIVGLTAVLAGLLVLISLPLALGAVAVVLVAVAAVVWNARRSPGKGWISRRRAWRRTRGTARSDADAPGTPG